MADILFVASRLPFPPNKGDKIRSFNILRHLATRHRIWLGTFVDDASDWAHVQALQPYCSALFVRPLKWSQRISRGIRGLSAGESLSASFYADPQMHAWVRNQLQHCDVGFAFMSRSARFFLGANLSKPWLVDLVDCDSERFRELARRARGPQRWLFRREGERLLNLERQAAMAAVRAILVSREEAQILAKRAPEIADRLMAVENGVDADFFDPACVGPDPWGEPGVPRLVFTGIMNYAPNVEAVCWFTAEVLPTLRAQFGRVRFAIVGAKPTRQVEKLAAPPDTLVTGRVDDVRGWIGHADIAVAPLWLARGVQNKVLEAMAMARPVIASPGAAEGLHARPGLELLVAPDAPSFVQAITSLLSDRARAAALGAAARAYVRRWHNWNVTLAPLDAVIDDLTAHSRSPAHVQRTTIR